MKRISISPSFLLPLILFCAITSWLASLRINSVECVSNSDNCSTEVVAQLDQLKQKSLLFTNLRQWQQQHNQVAIIKYKKNLSGKVTVYLAAQPPQYQLQFADNQLWTVHDDGRLQPATEKKLPLIELRSACQNLVITNNQLKAEMHVQIQQFLKLYQQKHFQPWDSFICLDEQSSLIQIPSQPSVVLPSTELSIGLERLYLIIEKLKTETLQFSVKEIDVRFKLPVIRETQTIHS